MICMLETPSGFIPAEPQPNYVNECTHILISPTELSNSAFNLTALQGLQISIAIIVVWAVAFAFRVAIQSLKNDEGNF